MRLGKLEVKEFSHSANGRYWRCLCDCGGEKIVPTKHFDCVSSCGCEAQNRPRTLVGQKIGRLTVERLTGSSGNGAVWTCRCTCGSTVELTTNSINRGTSRSCGCLRRENTSKRFRRHGESGSRLFVIWGAMLSRCANLDDTNYGGRGITVCDAWRRFEPFSTWAKSHGYRDDLSIDRIDNNSNYEPDNCRWADAFVQNRNKRNTVIDLERLEDVIAALASGERVCDIARAMNVTYGAVYAVKARYFPEQVKAHKPK